MQNARRRILHSRFTRDLPYRVTVQARGTRHVSGLPGCGIVRGPWLPPLHVDGESAGVLSNGHPDSGFWRAFRAFGHFIWAKDIATTEMEARVGHATVMGASFENQRTRPRDAQPKRSLLLVNTHQPCPPRHDQHAQKPTLIKDLR